VDAVEQRALIGRLILRRRDIITLVGGAAALTPRLSFAQTQKREQVRRIGVLMGGSGHISHGYFADFVKGLQAQGWYDDGNLRIEVRWAGGLQELYDRYAAELVSLMPNLIVAQTSPAVAALKRQTDTVPIVFVDVADPVGQGFVANQARPGGNITGFANLNPAIAGKHIEMLTQISPRVSSVAVLYNPATAPLVAETMRILDAAAKTLAITVRAVPFREAGQIPEIMTVLSHEQHGGLLVLLDISASHQTETIVNAAFTRRLPAVYPERSYADAGGLMSYGASHGSLLRGAAEYVDHILNGAKPGDLPLQYPTKFERVLNQRTAAALGVTFAQSLLAGADEVIE
jgi:putative tryptophan/tyrosine transport system substrate-binding protein